MPKRIVDKTITLDDLEGVTKETKAKKKAVKSDKTVNSKKEKKTVDETMIPDTEVVTESSDVSAETADVATTEKTETKEETPKKSSSKSKKAKQKKFRSERYKKVKKEIETGKAYSIDEAVKMVRKTATAQFKESVELHINLGTDTQNTDHRIRFTTTLPHGIGKSITVLVISDDNSGKKGDVIYRDKSVVDEIVSGKMQPDKDFNVVVSTPNAMKDIAKAARILGPKGMMPSPKNNTVTETPQKAIDSLSKGQIEIKSQPSHAVIHQIIGNLTFKDEQLSENAKALLEELNKNTPPKMKKKLVQKVYLCSTMGPSVRVEY